MTENQFDIAFDWDGTLTSGDGPIGQDNGAEIDLYPLRLCLEAGRTVAVMTCNEAPYVASVLASRGITAFADTAMAHKVPDGEFGGQVLVTNRKVLAAVYADDRNITWKFGDDPRYPLACTMQDKEVIR